MSISIRADADRTVADKFQSMHDSITDTQQSLSEVRREAETIHDLSNGTMFDDLD